MRARSFPPVVDEKTRVLILGSMPGPESLRRRQYYGHPQNQFWRILGQIINRPLQEMVYEEKRKELLRHGIGLWDVYAECERKGSSDTDIRCCVKNDVPGLLARHPLIRIVLFNGTKATSAWQRALGREAVTGGDRRTIKTFSLPSTSPAHTMPFAEKLAAWQKALQDGYRDSEIQRLRDS